MDRKIDRLTDRWRRKIDKLTYIGIEIDRNNSKLISVIKKIVNSCIKKSMEISTYLFCLNIDLNDTARGMAECKNKIIDQQIRF